MNFFNCTLNSYSESMVACKGAYLVGDAIKAEYERVHVSTAPEMANVRGIEYISGVSASLG